MSLTSAEIREHPLFSQWLEKMIEITHVSNVLGVHPQILTAVLSCSLRIDELSANETNDPTIIESWGSANRIGIKIAQVGHEMFERAGSTEEWHDLIKDKLRDLE